VPLDEHRRALAGAANACDQVRPGRIPGIGLRLAACVFEDAADEGDAVGFVAGWVRGVEPDQLLEKLGGSQEVKPR
jgi:hypothetical protein